MSRAPQIEASLNRYRAIAESRIEQLGEESERQLQQILRAQRSLAWLLSVSTLAITVGFFAMMTTAATALSRVVLGNSITLANVLAASAILFYMVAITVFARQSAGWDLRSREIRGKQ